MDERQFTKLKVWVRILPLAFDPSAITYRKGESRYEK